MKIKRLRAGPLGSARQLVSRLDLKLAGQNFNRAHTGGDMKPSRIMRLYLTTTCLVGILLTAATSVLLKTSIIEMNAALILPLCWNVLFMLILPLVLDWSEQKYLKARFLQLEELAQDNPELKNYLEQQCEKLALAKIKVAVIDSPVEETFSYGLLRYNPRLIVSSSMLSDTEKAKAIPSIESELNRFAKQEVSLYFIGFTVLQIVVQQLIFRFV
jgi:Zn-dependent protease with chaperone function